MSRTFIRHASEGAFETVAPGIHVRDLGIGALTEGAYTLQVVRLDPEGARVELLHRHDEGFSLAYVLNGWLDVEFAQIGLHNLGPATVVPAFNGPLHREVDCSPGFELLLLVAMHSMNGGDEQHIIVQQEEDAPVHVSSHGDYRYRDFDLAASTGGRMRGHAALALPGRQAPARWRAHDDALHVVYLAAGWAEYEFEDVGRVRLGKHALACVPAGVRHAEVAHSDDAVVIEMATRVNAA